MEADFDKSAADMMEEVRAVGGETLVRKVERARELEQALVKQIETAHQDFLQTAEREGLPEALACASICGAYSHAYAISIALLGSVTNDPDRSALVATAINSLMNNLDKQFDNVAALKDDIADKVVAAAKRVGPLPEGE